MTPKICYRPPPTLIFNRDAHFCFCRSGFSSDNQQLSFSSAVYSHSRDNSRDDNLSRNSRQGRGQHSRENSGLVSDSDTPQYARLVSVIVF